MPSGNISLISRMLQDIKGHSAGLGQEALAALTKRFPNSPGWLRTTVERGAGPAVLGGTAAAAATVPYGFGRMLGKKAPAEGAVDLSGSDEQILAALRPMLERLKAAGATGCHFAAFTDGYMKKLGGIFDEPGPREQLQRLVERARGGIADRLNTESGKLEDLIRPDVTLRDRIHRLLQQLGHAGRTSIGVAREAGAEGAEDVGLLLEQLAGKMRGVPRSKMTLTTPSPVRDTPGALSMLPHLPLINFERGPWSVDYKRAGDAYVDGLLAKFAERGIDLEAWDKVAQQQQQLRAPRPTKMPARGAMNFGRGLFRGATGG